MSEDEEDKYTVESILANIKSDDQTNIFSLKPHYQLLLKFFAKVEMYYKENYPICCKLLSKANLQKTSKEQTQNNENLPTEFFCFDCSSLFCKTCSFMHKGHETFCFNSFKGDFILKFICYDLKTEVNDFFSFLTCLYTNKKVSISS